MKWWYYCFHLWRGSFIGQPSSWKFSWWCGTVVERRSSACELFLSCARMQLLMG